MKKIFRWPVLLTLILLMLLSGIGFKLTILAQDISFFQLIIENQTRYIDLVELKNDFDYGTATIKLDLNLAGQITKAEVHPDADRRGSEEFGSRLIDILKTWRYTRDIEGIFFVSVTIPSPTESRDGKISSISIDLTRLKLPQGITIGLQKEQQLQLVAQDGFFDNVFLTGVPVEVKDEYHKTPGVILGNVFEQLGFYFQILFVFVFIVLIFAFTRALKTINKAWEPGLKKKSVKSYFVKSKDFIIGADGDSNSFNSYEVQKVTKIWENSIRDTHLDFQFFQKYKLDEDRFKYLKKDIQNADSIARIKEILVDKNNPVEKLDMYFINCNQNGMELEDLTLSQFKRIVTELLERELSGADQGKKERVRQVLGKLDACETEAKIELLLDENDCPFEKMLLYKKLDERPLGDVKQEILAFLEVLENIHHDLSTNNNHHEKSEKLSDKVWQYIGAPRVDWALKLSKKYKKYNDKDFPIFDIFESGLQNHLINRTGWFASQEIDRSIDRTAAVKIEERRGVLDWLWSVGSLSPMFGLFGTVWGISQAFGKIKGVTDTRLLMQKLAGDINIALSTTIVGLILGVLAFISYYYFKYHLDSDASRIETFFTKITNLK